MTNQDYIRPLILISNDDGIEAPGVHRLIDFVSHFGDIICVCPDGPRSGQSMAITVSSALRIKSLPDYNGAKMYSINGTPVDCVKLAMHTLLPRRPDLVLAGINHGSNAAVNVVYSGTMGATFEGCSCGIPAIGFSLTNHSYNADFRGCQPFVEELVARVLEYGLPDGMCLNVNVPDTDSIPKEMRVVRACRGAWSDEYRRYTDPAGHGFFMLSGRFENYEPAAEDTDEWCLHHGIVSVVPTLLDRTAPADNLPDWILNLG